MKIEIKSSNVTIQVRSMDASILFYESIGLTLKQRWGDHYAMMETAGVTLGLHPSQETTVRSSGTVSVGFMISDIQDAKDLLGKLGIKSKYEDGKSGKYLHFSDPNGTVLYFTQPKWE